MRAGMLDPHIYEEKAECVSISVASSLPVSSRQVDIPAAKIQSGSAISVSPEEGACAYRWVGVTGRDFANVYITVKGLCKSAVRAVKQYISGAIRSLKMSLQIRRPAFLRL